MKKNVICLFLIIASTVNAQNLLINGSAELPITANGWTQVSGNWQQRTGSPPPQNGSAYFFAGANSYAELFQEVDVSSNSANIDLGTEKYSFSCFLRSFGQSPSDNSKAIVTYLDASSTVLDTYDTGFSSDTNNWVYFADVRIVPIGTRSIKITLISTRNSGTNNDGYIDNVILEVGDTLPPSNDFCNSPINIPITVSNPVTVVTNTTFATSTVPSSSCENSSQTWLDQWYTFTMPVNGNIYITQTSFRDSFTLYNSCGSAEIACFNNSSIFYSLVNGTTYTLKFSNRNVFAGSNSFNIQAFETATNDNCSTPETIPINTNTVTTVNTNTLAATASNVLSSCENTSQIWLDQWYTFTMPFTGNIHITQTSFRDSFTLYNFCGDAEIACFNNNGNFYSLTNGATYTLKFSNRNVFASTNSFNIQAFEIATNDNCSTPETIPINTNTAITVNTNTLTATASTAMDSCDDPNLIYLDQYYTFTMPVNGNVYISGVNIFDRFTLYDACNGNELYCFSDDGFFYSLAQNTIYTLRYAKRDIYASVDSFSIQAFEAALNSNCASAIPITVQTNTFTQVDTNTQQSSISTDISSCQNSTEAWLDLWYTFTMPVNGNVRITSMQSTIEYVTIYDACGIAANEIACYNGGGYAYSLNAGTTYTIKYSQIEFWSGVNSFRIQAFETAPNIDCASAIPITVQTNTFTQVDTNTQQSSISTDISSCQNSTEAWLDLWYTFTMPVNGNARITSMQNTIEYVTIYDACGIAANEIACHNGGGYAYSLIAGTTYTIKYSQMEFWSGVNSFRIQAFETTLNSDCANAESISINTNTFTIVNTNTQSSTLSPNLSSCQNTNENWLDQWFSFTMPIDGNVQITHISNISEYLSLYDACGGNELGCFTNNGTINSLASGTTYYIKYAQTEFWSDQNNFRIKAIETASNDLCLDAINLNVGIYDEFSQNKTFFGASPSQAPLPPSPTCAVSSSNNDTWFTVQVPDSGKLTIETKQSLGSTLTNTAMQVFENSCGSFVEIGCDDNSGNGNFSKVEITGRVPLETLYIRLIDNANATDYYTVFAYDNNCTSVTFWDGTSWSNLTPDLTKIAVFNANYSTDTASIDACTCVIKDNVIVNVNSNQYLNLDNDIFNNGTLNINHEGSFVQINNNANILGNGNFKTVIKTTVLQDEDRFTYISSPVENNALTKLNSWAKMNYLWNYDGSVQDWNYISSQFETMEIARGYAVEGRSDLDYPNPVGTTNFTGKFNNGTITQPLYYNAGGIDDDNTLVGNPYPSAISISALLNPIINPDALSVYVWTHKSALINEVYENDDYISCSSALCTSAYADNDINNINGYLASGQGFFVTANALGTLTLNNTMRVTDNNLQFRTPDQEKLWINLSSTEGYFNQIAISFTDNGSENYDEKFDAIRLGNYYGLGFYTIGTNNERFAVDENGILLQNKTIPLGLYLNDSQADNLIISLDHFENLDNVNVTLRDNLLNTLHNLKISDYTFNPNFIGSEINIVNNRFELIFERNALGVNDLNNTERLLITNNDNNIDVSTLNQSIISEFNAYDILGKLIFNTKPNKSSFTIPTSIKQGTVLFIKAKLENGQILNTKFIKS